MARVSASATVDDPIMGADDCVCVVEKALPTKLALVRTGFEEVQQFLV